MNIELILFDLDGTLLDTAPQLTATLNKLREEKNLPPLSVDEIRHVTSGGVNAFLEIGLQVLPDNPAYPRFRRKFLEYYQKDFLLRSKLFPDVEKLLKRLDELKINYGVVTNKHARFTEPLLESTGLATSCKVIVCGDTLPFSKPSPEPLLHACQQVNIPPSKTIFVGDSENDLLAAKAAAINAFWVNYGYDNLETLYGAKEIDNPLQLLDYL